nr:hypothetical protein Iba_chr12cCG13980 [Ipomoea batatas]
MKGRGLAPLPRRASPPFATPPPSVLCTTPTTAACNSDSRRRRRYQKFQCRPDLRSSDWSTTASPKGGSNGHWKAPPSRLTTAPTAVDRQTKRQSSDEINIEEQNR